MHKKDKVKEVIQKYVDQGMDFFELTPSYLVTLNELKGYSERTLKRGRTEYKNENRDDLKGKSKAKLNLQKKITTYLDENSNVTLDQLKKKFSTQDKKQLTEIFNQWSKEAPTTRPNKPGRKPAKKTDNEDAGSLRQKVFAHLDQNPELTLSKLERVFQEENKKTVSNYLDQWRKERSTKGKRISTKQRINDYLDENPTATLKILKSAFPDINPSSIGAYHSLWKNENRSEIEIKPDKKPGRKPANQVVQAQSPLSVESAKQIIDALNNTVEAQKKAIEALKSQNIMLEEIKAYSFPELKGMSKKEIDKFERVMATFLKGLRK